MSKLNSKLFIVEITLSILTWKMIFRSMTTYITFWFRKKIFSHVIITIVKNINLYILFIIVYKWTMYFSASLVFLGLNYWIKIIKIYSICIYIIAIIYIRTTTTLFNNSSVNLLLFFIYLGGFLILFFREIFLGNLKILWNILRIM